MTHGNLWKNILFYSIPLVLTNLLQLLFNIADVAIVGKFAGSISLGAVGSTTLLVVLTTGWLIGISSGVNAVVAFFAGANDPEHEHRAVQTGLLLCLAAGLFTMLLGLLAGAPMLRLLGTKDELITEATLYLKIYLLGSPALALYNYGNAVLSAVGETKKPLIYLSVAGVINILLNLFFVIVLGMRSDGVAYASIIAQYISAVLILFALFRAEGAHRLERKIPAYDRNSAARILKIGIPAALQYSLFAVANLFVQSAVNSFDHVIVEGNSAAMNFDSVVYESMAAFYVATTGFIAQNYGAGKRDRVRKTYAITTVYSFGLAFVLGLIAFRFRAPLLGLFTNDAEVVAAGSIRLNVLCFSWCLSAFMDNATAACRGLGKTLVPTAIVLMGTIVFRIVWIYTVFAHFGTLSSLYLLYGCAFVITGIFQNIYYFRLYRKTFGGHETPREVTV
ncbi:MAG: MATE family efflux transporter [Clostridia bacterium]|nr:MATE family efflux transporter [Clostridia bacterium]